MCIVTILRTPLSLVTFDRRPPCHTMTRFTNPLLFNASRKLWMASNKIMYIFLIFIIPGFVVLQDYEVISLLNTVIEFTLFV